ncbi:MAG: GAF domain-containing protein, partial [Acidiferrobacterales bacterium]
MAVPCALSGTLDIRVPKGCAFVQPKLVGKRRKPSDPSDRILPSETDPLHQLASHFGSIPIIEIGQSRPIDPSTFNGRVIAEGKTIHVHDLAASGEEFPGSRSRGIARGVRTALAAPLLHENHVIGCIHIRRKEVRPFSGSQIKLLETFADQAVIAIENVRLFQESQSRNRDLTESLDQQTATSEVLRVISSSPTDVQPVFDAIVQSATRLCDASFG